MIGLPIDMVASWMQDPDFRAEYERLEREEGPMLDAILNARREAGLTSRRSAQAGAQQAMFVPVTVVGDRTSCENSPSDVAHDAAGRIEIEIAGARMTVIGSVAPELAQAMVAALRARR